MSRTRHGRARTALCWLRSAVGVAMCLAPARAGRAFGVGPALVPAGAALVGRLFAVRDLVLAQALRHPDPTVQRQVLRAGVAVDGVDVAASLLAAYRGGRRSGLVGVGLGALLFVGMGLTALQDPDLAA